MGKIIKSPGMQNPVVNIVDCILVSCFHLGCTQCFADLHMAVSYHKKHGQFVSGYLPIHCPPRSQ